MTTPYEPLKKAVADEETLSRPLEEQAPWYSGITRYQWMVLLIACLGWIFDVFEGQIFVASMQEAMPSLAPEATEGRIALYNNIANGAFLLGGALGGIFFGMLSDRIGRKQTMALTILFYSLFTCLSAFSQQWWHLAGLRFFVAMGVGGEWAVASSLVAEVFPSRARAHAGSIFHASSILGTWLAIAAGAFLIGNPALYELAEGPAFDWAADYVDRSTIPWRLGFAIGLLPALLIIWVRLSLREPESWKQARTRAREDTEQRMGRISDLFNARFVRNTVVGVLLASAGLATFWGVHIFGKNVLMTAVEQQLLAEAAGASGTLDAAAKAAVLEEHQTSIKRWEMLGMFLVSTGGGIGLVTFGPLSQRIGRRGAFRFFYLGGLISGLAVFGLLYQYPLIPLVILTLPIFGFLTLGMHAGYAVYFPELYPTRLRGTGTGFCFNAGRMIAAPTLFLIGMIQDRVEWFTLPWAAGMISCLFLVGAVVLVFAPETRGRELPT